MQLFYDDADRQEFLGRLWRYRDACGVKVLSWCLMANHVHLLVMAGLSDISPFMKRLQLSFSHYYNRRYDRTGYLFQGCYGSVPIRDDGQLLAVVRYIHRNPLEVGRSVRHWTSYDEIVQASGATDVEELLRLLGIDEARAIGAFIALVKGESDDRDIPTPRHRISDEEASRIITDVAGTETCQAFCDLDPPAREAALARIKAHGPSVRQIARLTGLNRGLVQRVRVSGETSP